MMIPYDHARAATLRVAFTLANATKTSAARAQSAAIALGVAASLLKLLHLACVDAQTAADLARSNYIAFLHDESARVLTQTATLLSAPITGLN